MVSEKKLETMKEVSSQIENYSVIGILDMHKLPARQLHEIRNKLRGEAVIRVVKKRLILRMLQESKFKGISSLADNLVLKEPALLFSNADPFKLARSIQSSKSYAKAKEGDITPRDIEIKAGPTSLSAGPVIGELQRAKIPAGVEGEKIVIKKDAIVAKQGDVISKELAGILAKLDVTPIEIGLNLLAAWNDGTIYHRNTLFVPLEKYVEDLKRAHANAFGLTVSIGYITKENISLLLSKAHMEAMSLAMEAGIITEETLKLLLSKAYAQARGLEGKIKWVVPEQQAEEPN